MRRLGFWAPFFICCAMMVAQGVSIASNRSLVLDEATTLLHSFRAMQGNWAELFADIHMPVYNVLVAVWLKIFGFEVVSAKSFSVLCGLATLVATYLLAERFANRRVALFAVALLAFSPLMTYYSQLARSYALFVAMGAASSYFYLASSQEWFSLRRRSTWLFVLSTFALMATHMVGAGILVVQSLHVLITSRQERSTRRLVSWMKVVPFVLFAYLPVAMTILNRYELKKVIPKIYSWVAVPTFADLMRSVSYSNWDSDLVIGFFFVGIAAALLRKRRDPFVSYLALWLILPPVLLFLYSHLHHPIFIKRGLAPQLVPFVVLTAIGFGTFGFLSRKIALLALVAVSWWGWAETTHMATIEEESWSSLARTVREQREASRSWSIVHIRPGYAWPPFLYYHDRECFFSMDPELCLPKTGIVRSLSDSVVIEGAAAKEVTWFVGYGSDAQRNRQLIEEFERSGRAREIVKIPDLYGFEAIRFSLRDFER